MQIRFNKVCALLLKRVPSWHSNSYLVGRGMIPGSEQLARKRIPMTKTKMTAPTAPMAGLIDEAKKRQSKAKKRAEMPKRRRSVR